MTFPTAVPRLNLVPTARGWALGLSVLGAAVLAGTAHAGASGSATANFLKLGVGARGVAMGDAQTAATDDVMSLYWNPAGMADLSQQEVGFMHNNYVAGVDQDVLFYARPTEGGNVWGVGLSHLRVRGIDGFDEFGIPTGDVDASDSLVTLGWARPWPQLPWLAGLRTGVNVKALQKTLDQDSALGFMMDLGVMHEIRAGRLEGLKTGVALQHLGPGLKVDEQSSPLPWAAKWGWAYPVFGDNMTLALDMVLPSEGDFHVNLGADYRLWDILAARVGFKGDNNVDSGVTYGLRFGNERLHLDYAFVPFGVFGDSHRVSLGFRFGRAYRQAQVTDQIEGAFKRAVAKYGQGYLVEAYMQSTAILAIAPWHRQAKLLADRIEYEFKSIETDARQAQLQAQVDEHYARGEQLLQIDDMLNARREFEAILALQPDHMGAKTYLSRIDDRFRSVASNFYTLAVQAFSNSNFELAREYANKVVSVEPNHEEARTLLERVKEAIIEIQKEASQLAREQKIGPLMGVGQKHFEDQRYEEALGVFAKVLEIDTGHSEARRLRDLCKQLIAKNAFSAAQAAAQKGEFGRAQSFAKKALRFRSPYPEAATLLEDIQVKADEINKAESARLYRDSLDAFLSGDRQKALELAEEALSLDKENKEAERMVERLKSR